MTAESAHHEVEFQLNLCGSDMSYQDLIKHLSVTFQGGEDEANLLAEFYSHSQKAKETEEAFAWMSYRSWHERSSVRNQTSV